MASAVKLRRPLMKTTRLRIPAGESAKVRLRLTAAGRTKLRHKRKLTIRVAVVIRAGGHVIDSHTERFVFKRKRGR